MRRQKSLSEAVVPVRRERSSSSLQGRLSILVGAILAVCAVTIATSGGTFALWNSQATISPATITAGSLNLSISNQSLGGLSTKLTPGASVLGSYEVGYTGGTAADLVATVAVTTSTPAAMAGAVTLTITPSTATCVAGMTGGVSGKLNAFGPTPSVILPIATTEAKTRYCVELKLDSTAGNELQNATTSFSVTYTATQRTS